MKRIALICLFLITTIRIQAVIIWDFDSPATCPTSAVSLGSFYVYTDNTVAGLGVNGTNALRITVPAKVRSWGGGFELANFGSIDISGNPWVSWFIMASDTSPFGVSFQVYDTTGSKFIPAGVTYTADAQRLAGTINKKGFQRVDWNVGAFHKYQGTTSPDLSAITMMSWIFPDNTAKSTGPMYFYLDNVCANTNAPVTAELTAPKSKQK